MSQPCLQQGLDPSDQIDMQDMIKIPYSIFFKIKNYWTSVKEYFYNFGFADLINFEKKIYDNFLDAITNYESCFLVSFICGVFPHIRDIVVIRSFSLRSNANEYDRLFLPDNFRMSDPTPILKKTLPKINKLQKKFMLFLRTYYLKNHKIFVESSILQLLYLSLLSDTNKKNVLKRMGKIDTCALQQKILNSLDHYYVKSKKKYINSKVHPLFQAGLNILSEKLVDVHLQKIKFAVIELINKVQDEEIFNENTTINSLDNYSEEGLNDIIYEILKQKTGNLGVERIKNNSLKR